MVIYLYQTSLKSEDFEVYTNVDVEFENYMRNSPWTHKTLTFCPLGPPISGAPLIFDGWLYGYSFDMYFPGQQSNQSGGYKAKSTPPSQSSGYHPYQR